MTNQIPPIPICESCLNLKVTGGDWVPWGMGNTQLPDEWDCSAEWKSKDADERIMARFQGKIQKCRYFKAFPFCKKHPETRTTRNSDTGCPECDEIFYKQMEKAEKASEKMMEIWQEAQ